MAKKSKRSASIKVDDVAHRYFIESLSKLLGSWFGNKDILTPVSNNEAEKIGNLLPTLFQTGSKVMKPRKVNDKQSRFYIDLNKLEKSSTINKEEKEKLKRLVRQLKCENPRDKCINESRKKKTVAKKVNNTFMNESKRKKGKRTHGKQNEKKDNAIKSTKPKAKGITSHQCQICLGIVEENAKTKRKKRKQSSTITVSEEKVLQSILELDPRARGDTISSCELRQRAWPGKNINIKNIELKYVNPTYVVQYTANTTNNGTENEPESEQRFGRQRFYSSAALESHLGQRPVLNVEGVRSVEEVTMHYDPSVSHLIGVGLETERMMVEREKEMSLRQSTRQRVQAERSHDQGSEPRVSIMRRRPNNEGREWQERRLQKQVAKEEPWRGLKSQETVFDDEVYRTFSLNQKDVKIETPGVEEKEVFVGRKWSKDTRNPLEVLSQYDHVEGEQERSAPTSGKRCRRLRRFVKKCLCLTTEEGSEANIARGKAAEIINAKNNFVGQNVKKTGKGEMTVVRITEEEFNKNQIQPEQSKLLLGTLKD